MNTVLTWPDLERQIRLRGEFERRALSHLLRGQPSTADPNKRLDAQLTFGQRVADCVAAFGGSRIDAHTDYEVNRRAEMEIMRLPAKLDAVRLESLRQPHQGALTAGDTAGEGNT